MIVLGLTGSIGMGKSMAATMLRKLGVPVHEADNAVHRLLKPGEKGAWAVGAAFPYFSYPQIYGRKTKVGARTINRKTLGEIVFNDARKREKLESILHPLVQEAQADFIRRHKSAKTVVLDIPLLFETGAEKRVDSVVVVTAPYSIQRNRVLSRPGMTEQRFQAILERQMPDTEKRARADYIVHTGLGRAQMMRELKSVLREVTKNDQNSTDICS